MKKYKLLILTFLLSSHIFAIGGIGFYGNYDLLKHDGSESNEELFTIKANPFENAYGGGFYLYIDAIPVIDLEINGEFALNKHNVSFSAPDLNIAFDEKLPWARGSLYITARKKIIGLSIPFLAKAKLYAGVGINTHIVTPEYTLELLTNAFETDPSSSLLDGNVKAVTTFGNHVAKNMNSVTGAHVQAGLQARLLMFDMFLNARYTLAKDVIPGKIGFPSLWLGIGYGI
jgi:hypothetical protein